MGFFLKAWKHFHSFAWAQVLRSTLSYSMHGCSARKGTGLSLLSTSTSKHATPARSVEPENGCWVMTWTNSLVFPLQRPCDSIRPVTKRCGKRRPGFTQNCQRRRRPRVWSCNFFLSKNNVKTVKLQMFVSCNFARSSGSTFASLKMLRTLRCAKKSKGFSAASTRTRAAAAAAASRTTNGKRLMIRRKLRKMKSPRRKKRRVRWGYVGCLNPKLFLLEGMFYEIKIIKIVLPRERRTRRRKNRKRKQRRQIWRQKKRRTNW